MEMLAAAPFEFKGQRLTVRFADCPHCSGHPAVIATHPSHDGEEVIPAPNLGMAFEVALMLAATIMQRSSGPGVEDLPELPGYLRALGEWVERVDAILDAETHRIAGTLN